MSVTRKAVNFLIAIVLTAFVCGIIFALPPFYPPTLQYPDVAFGIVFTVWLFSLPVVALGGLVIGMPAARVLKLLNIVGFIRWATAGAVAGALYSFLVMFVVGGFPDTGADALLMALAGVLPGIAAGAYWWGAVGRHDEAEGGAI